MTRGLFNRVHRVAVLVAAVALTASALAQDLRLPLKADSVRFAVIGDSGTGETHQYDVGVWMAKYWKVYPFQFVIMMGDNMYGGQKPNDFLKKFELPYKPLLDGGVQFYATLGNHDEPDKAMFYKPFNMDGRRYYTFTKGPIEFFVLDSDYMDPPQIRWVEEQLQQSNAGWKIAYFHHPLYSSGARHGSQVDLRVLLEPLFIKYGINVVFSGHDHFYERIKPQKGIYYFVSGGAGKLRENNIRKTDLTAAGFDADLHFMMVEVAGDELYFQAISRTGETVDAGVLAKTPATTASPQPAW